ncbi:cytochrome P450 [Streptomyces rubellomurinus]|uniref:cytochrome P450 family protein n=1 Tax=Streptomyces rubellomurinus (strain ATCC 31215) TaxID=359131 RepID=UPI003133C0E3
MTSEKDVRTGLSDPRLSVNKAHARRGYKGFALPPTLDANLLNIDPADHLRVRRLVSKAFTPRHVEGLRVRVHNTADQLAEGLAGKGVVDFIEHFAKPLPLTVIGDLLGVPEDGRRPFSNWVDSMFDPEHPGQVTESVDHIHHFLINLIDARRATPRDDLLSAMITARDESDRLSEDELASLAFLILFAGVESTQHVISNGLLALLCHPEQFVKLREDAKLIDNAVEEILRYSHPNQMAVRRFPIRDITISGVHVPAGDTVMLGLASANRDPACYPEPDSFDLLREFKQHLAFGHGMHYCLGAPLARMEIRAALETLLRNFSQITLAIPVDELEWRASFRSHALKKLPIEICT